MTTRPLKLVLTDSGKRRLTELGVKMAQLFPDDVQGLKILPDDTEATDHAILAQIEVMGNLDLMIEVPQLAPLVRTAARRLHEAGFIDVDM